MISKNFVFRKKLHKNENPKTRGKQNRSLTVYGKNMTNNATEFLFKRK